MPKNALFDQKLDEFLGSYFKKIENDLADRLIAIYKIGSLAHGGFSPLFSDLDIALMVSSKIDEETLYSIQNHAKQTNADLAERLSLFWSNPEFAFGRFPVLDRLDLIDHGILVRGSRVTLATRPDRNAIHEALLDHANGYWSKMTEKYSAMDSLSSAKDAKELTRAFLYPARFLFSWLELKLGSNDEAVDFILKLQPKGLSLEPIQMALDCRREISNPEALLDFVPLLKRQRETTLKFIKALI